MNSHLVGVGFVGPDAVNAQAQDLRIEILELLLIVDHAGVLFGAGWAPVEGIEDQDYAFLAFVVAELYFLLILISQGEFRGWCADGWWHDSSVGLFVQCGMIELHHKWSAVDGASGRGKLADHKNCLATPMLTYAGEGSFDYTITCAKRASNCFAQDDNLISLRESSHRRGFFRG